MLPECICCSHLSDWARHFGVIKTKIYTPNPYVLSLLRSLRTRLTQKVRKTIFNFRKDVEETGQLIYSQDFTNTYYHPVISHIIRKNPVFTRLVSISRGLFNSLDNNQRTILDSSGFNIIIN